MEKTKLDIAATLKQAFALYKQNFWALLKFALVGFLCSLPSTVSNYIKGLEDDRIARAAEAFQMPEVWDSAKVAAYEEWMESMTRSRGTAILVLVLSLLSVALFFAVRMKNELGAQLYLADIMAGGEGEKPTMKRAYAKTKGKIADMLGLYLMLGVIACFLLAPFVILFASLAVFTEINQNLLMGSLVLIIAPVAVLSYPWFLLIFPMAAFEEEKSQRLSFISQRIKGNFLPVAVVSFFGIGIVTMLGSIIKLLPVHALIAAGITSVITLLTFGFGSAAAFVTYQKLRPEQMSQEPSIPPEYYVLPAFEQPQADRPEEEENSEYKL